MWGCLCFYLFLHALPLHNTTQTSTNQAKTQGSRNRKSYRLLYIETNVQFSPQKTIHHLRHNDKNKLVQEDPLNFSPLNEEIHWIMLSWIWVNVQKRWKLPRNAKPQDLQTFGETEATKSPRPVSQGDMAKQFHSS